VQQEYYYHPSKMKLLTNLKQLSAYYSVISDITSTFKSIAAPHDYTPGFVGTPEPNRFYDRTPKGLFIETDVCKQGNKQGRKEIASRLYTPFGRVLLADGGWVDEMQEISHAFLSTLKLDDVTSTLKTGVYEKDGKITKIQGIRSETYEHSGAGVKVYQLKDCIIDSEPDSEYESLMVYRAVLCNDREYTRDRAVFRKLSNGKMRFMY
jgi:hypothetical protein